MTTTSPRAGQAAVVDAHRFHASAGTNSSADQGDADNHASAVGAGPHPRDSHGGNGAHSPAAVAGQTSGPAMITTEPRRDSPVRTQTAQPTMRVSAPSQGASAGQPTSPVARQDAGNSAASPPGDQNCGGREALDIHVCDAAAPNSDGHPTSDHHEIAAVTGQPATASPRTAAIGAPPWLADPFLQLAADVLNDLEQVRVANANRLAQLTRTEPDADGIIRGFGLDQSHPDVARLAAIVDTMAKAEHAATLNLQRILRQHPLGPWVKSMSGVGEKQAARLLAAIGDPYIRPEMHYADGRPPEPARPRTVSELWAYCGYHVVPAGQPCTDHHPPRASGDPASVRHSGSGTHGFRADGTNPATSHSPRTPHTALAGGGPNGGNPDQRRSSEQITTVGVAATRTRGQRANWSSTAKSKAWLIADSCVKQLKQPCRKNPDLGYAIHTPDCRCSPYRVVYDQARAKYADAEHQVPCVRCGPASRPAQPGTALSDGHKHARAMRIVAKTLLRDLWVEASRVHCEADDE